MGSIEVIKKVTGGVSGDSFSFTTAGSGLADFNLANNQSALFPNLETANVYKVTEQQSGEFFPPEITCSS